MANATMISIDEMYLKKDQTKKPEAVFEKLSQHDLEVICNEIVDGGSSSALGNHVLEKEVDVVRDQVILMHGWVAPKRDNQVLPTNQTICGLFGFESSF
jgi:hypothetical protein